jgi:hypothetical protein
MTKARDIADFKFEDIVDTGTEGTKVASGTTAQRGSTTGQLRFNTTTGLAEYYTGTEFKAIDTPPTITSIDVTNVATDLGGTETFVITGSLFSGSATVKFRDNGGTLITPDTTTVNSASQITVTKTRSSFSNANEPYDVIVTNPSGLEAVLDDQINVDNTPAWQTASGQVGGTIYENVTNVNTTITATDTDGDTITYSITSGALPTGVTLNSSSGLISGTPSSAISTDTTYNFTATATANNKSANRAFNFIVKNTNSGEHLDVASSSMTGGENWFNRQNTYYGTEWNNSLSGGDLIEKFWWRDSGISNNNSRRWFLVLEQKANSNYSEAYIVAGWRYVTTSTSSDGQIETFLSSNAQTTVGSLLTGNKFVVPSSSTYGNGVYQVAWVTNDTRNSYSYGDGDIYFDAGSGTAPIGTLISGVRGTVSWRQDNTWSAGSMDYPDVMGVGGLITFTDGLASSSDAGQAIHVNMGTA